MELKSQDIRDVIIKLQGQIELLNSLFNQAVDQEKKANEPAQKDN
jgi:hypothetical protein